MMEKTKMVRNADGQIILNWRSTRESELFLKHFGHGGPVRLDHPNMEAYWKDLLNSDKNDERSIAMESQSGNIPLSTKV